ncbi:MAG: hypothetical protein F6K56_41120 [Moorea sp. SIO3G5]|nr:hypothetical protein [Moorena sp. SIO3G5]
MTKQNRVEFEVKMRKFVSTILAMVIISLSLLMSPAAASADRQGFRFPVDATSECPAHTIQNPFSSIASLTYIARGQWTNGPDGALVDPNGDFSQDCPQCKFPVPPERLNELVAYDDHNEFVLGAGASDSFNVSPGQEISFCMNDAPGTYYNNLGSVDVFVMIAQESKKQ